MKKVVYLFSIPLAGLLGAFLVFQLIQTERQVRAAPNLGTFFNNGQALGNADSRGVALGDLDNDGDLDAVTANYGPNHVWLNSGYAHFSDSGQQLGALNSEAVVLGDLDGDTYLDAVVANANGPNQVWLNNGAGQFSPGQAFDSAVSRGVALGDLDGDLDLDVFIAKNSGNTVWLNTSGALTDSLQSLGTNNSYAVALEDLDGDSDLDAFVSNGLSGPQADTVWINQGGAQLGNPGQFLDSGQTLGAAWTYAAALGDLDGTNGPDALTASWFPVGNIVYLNDGSGTFTDTGQMLGTAGALGAALGDVDGDLDLDVFVTTNTPAGNQLWLNDGAGTFTDSGQVMDPNTTSYDAGLEDLDGDGDLDLFVANFGPNTVWINAGAGLPPAFFDVARETNDNGDEVYYWATGGDAVLPVLLTYPYTASLEVHARVQMPGGTFTESVPFTVGQQVRFLNLVNPQPDPTETITLTLSVTSPTVPPGPADITDELVLVFIDGDQGLTACILCYIEWLGRFTGFNPIFGSLHHLNLPDQEASPLWLYYTGLYDFYAPEMAGIFAAQPSLLWSALTTLDEWTPVVQDLEPEAGGGTIVTTDILADAINLVDGIKAGASPGLAAAIQHEQDALDLPSFAGMTITEAWEAIETRRPIEDTFITVIIK